MVLRVVCSIDWPTRWVTESSRSLTARAISAWRPASAWPIASTRPVASLWARSISLRRSSSSSARIGLRHRQFRAAPAGAGDHDGDDQEQHKRQRAEADQRGAGTNRQVADHKKNLVHVALVADSALNANEGRTFMVNAR